MRATNTRTRVRTMDERDREALRALGQAVAALHAQGEPTVFRLPEPPLETEPYDPKIADRLVLVAERAGRIVGFLEGFVFNRASNAVFRSCRIAFIVNIDVVSDRRGHGIGRRLNEAFERWARSVGAQRVELEVYSFNDAVEFYRKMEYRPLACRMSKDL
jgi:GNAT superfamily N-acetyltransferase